VFYLSLQLEIATARILSSRVKIKFYEAGMDLGLSSDPVESFKLFQGRVLKEYDRMASQYGFKVMDGTRSIDGQQQKVRAVVARLYDEAHAREAS